MSKYKLGIDSSIKIFRVDAERDKIRAAMTSLGRDPRTKKRTGPKRTLTK